MLLRLLRSRVAAVPLALALLHSAACSWIYVKKSPSGPIHATPPIECESGSWAPDADTGGAIALFVGGALVTVLGLAAGSSVCEGSGL